MALSDLINDLRESPSTVLAQLQERTPAELIAVISQLLIDQSGIGSKLLAVLPAKWRAYATVAVMLAGLGGSFGGGYWLKAALTQVSPPAAVEKFEALQPTLSAIATAIEETRAAAAEAAQKAEAAAEHVEQQKPQPMRFKVRIRDAATGKILGESEHGSAA